MDQYVVQNLTLSRAYLKSTLANNLLQKVLTLVPMIATRTEVYVNIMTTFISNYYNNLKDTLKHLKSLKLMRYYWENVAYFCSAILVSAD